MRASTGVPGAAWVVHATPRSARYGRRMAKRSRHDGRGDGRGAPDGDALWRRGQALAARGGRGLRRAVALYRQGAALRDPSCIAALAFHLDAGRGVRRDPAAARRMWARGARLGDAGCALNVGLSYKHAGRYVQARRWFEVALGLGDASAPLELGKLRLFGLGARRDVARGVAWLETAAASELDAPAGREEAMLLLAYVHLDGVFVARSWQIGSRWLARAAARGSELAATWRRDLAA
ncbi:MAG: sel1 repeat family protein [Myxococcales bacterium]|nr:sel1 repeat family protein [Myxococcales bacterium]